MGVFQRSVGVQVDSPNEVSVCLQCAEGLTRVYVDASAQTEYCDSSLRDQATQLQYDDDDLAVEVRMSTPLDDHPSKNGPEKGEK